MAARQVLALLVEVQILRSQLLTAPLDSQAGAVPAASPPPRRYRAFRENPASQFLIAWWAFRAPKMM